MAESKKSAIENIVSKEKDSEYVEMIKKLEDAYCKYHSVGPGRDPSHQIKFYSEVFGKVQELLKESPISAADLLIIVSQVVATKLEPDPSDPFKSIFAGVYSEDRFNHQVHK